MNVMKDSYGWSHDAYICTAITTAIDSGYTRRHKCSMLNEMIMLDHRILTRANAIKHPGLNEHGQKKAVPPLSLRRDHDSNFFFMKTLSVASGPFGFACSKKT